MASPRPQLVTKKAPAEAPDALEGAVASIAAEENDASRISAGKADDRLLIGKNIGRKFAEVMQVDPEYCAWMLEMSRRREATPVDAVPFVRFLEESLAEDRAVGGDGPLSNLTYRQVRERDPDFCFQLLRSERPAGELALLKSWLVRNMPADADVDLSKVVLNVRRHSNLTYREIMDQDIGYCHWVLSQELLPDDSVLANRRLARFQSWLRENMPTTGEAAARLPLGFGPHAKLTYQEVLEREPRYCFWVLRQAPGQKDHVGTGFDHFQAWLGENPPDIGTGEEWSNLKVGVGMHADMTYLEVLYGFPDHCLWALRLEDPGPRHAHFQSWLRENIHRPFTEEEATKFAASVGQNAAAAYRRQLSTGALPVGLAHLTRLQARFLHGRAQQDQDP